MTEALTTISKYAMVLFMILYTAGSYLALRFQRSEDAEGLYHILNVLTLFFHAFGFLIIFLNVRDFRYLLFYCAQVAFMRGWMLVYRRLYPMANTALLNHTLMFLMVGFVMQTRLDASTALKQFIMVCIAAGLSLAVPKMFAKLKMANIWGALTGVIGLGLLSAVLVIGRIYSGAKLGFTIAGVFIQPSEFVKISFVLLIALLFKDRHDKRRILAAGILMLAHVGILVLSKDLGAAVIYAGAFLFMLYAATRKPAALFIGFGGGGAAVFAGYKLTAFLAARGVSAAIVICNLLSHVATRFEVWLDPWTDYRQKGYQIGNALFGIATGGWFGQGLYHGQPKLIPVVESDFIFAGICEEMGGIVGICLILISIACLLMFIKVAAGLYLPFYKLTGIGLASVYGIQVLLNIGGVIKFIPSTGVTLPFVSYGINSIFSTFIMFGIMQELYIKRQNEVERIESAGIR